MNKKQWITAGTAVGIAAVCAAGYLYWCTALEDQVIWSDTVINGVELQGKTQKEAKKEIQKQFEKDYKDARIIVSLAGEEYELPMYEVLSMDAQKQIQKAYEPGHGKWYARGLDHLRLAGEEKKSMEVFPEPANTKELTDAILLAGIHKVNTVEETSCQLTDAGLHIKMGSEGVKADTEALREEILQTLMDHEYDAKIKCPEIKTAPKELNIQSWHDQVYAEVKDAYLDEANDYKVIPSVDGVTFDVKEAEEKLSQAEEREEVRIDFTVTEPELTTEELTSMLYRDVLGTYTTYGGGSSNRVTNIELACSSLNELILNPGEIFSYNETVGERTEARGFKSAPVIANGQLVPGLGGGICQVSTTLYAACLEADVEIVERYPHSKPVAYVPRGMDATVSWGTLDYRFKNNTEYPIKLQASYENGAITVQLLGTIAG